mmetsp:Transcript_28192/g.52902  ORF Transcript_28192/g.52902 Transcript_28192/m.52902 type:complete len:93 (-) Transcript_28192:19-297(-)
MLLGTTRTAFCVLANSEEDMARLGQHLSLECRETWKSRLTDNNRLSLFKEQHIALNESEAIWHDVQAHCHVSPLIVRSNASLTWNQLHLIPR